MVALVRPTGVGKTTLASLVPCFFDVTEGSISLGGGDMPDLSLKSLREQISIVLQGVFLFQGTARDNVLFGTPDATGAEIVEAAKVANAQEFIMQLPDGYDTLIGEPGPSCRVGRSNGWPSLVLCSRMRPS